MKRVVLLGDSIRIGYQEVVSAQLAGRAEVLVPEEDGGSSRKLLAHLDAWAIDFYPQVVHVNCGLDDLKRPPEGGETAVPLEEFKQNIRTILERLKRETKAKVTWATITPVLESWHRENNNFDRLEADVIAYNMAAADIAIELGVPIDNLYGMLLEADLTQFLLFDGAHFKDEGYSLIGRTVADFIGRFL